MNKKYRAVVLFLLCLLTLWGSSGTALGWVMPSQNEDEFLQWYEEHKDIGGEFTMSQRLTLKSGTADEPIILDGSGKIKINCGRSGTILIASPVIMNNPNLEIISEASSGIVMNSEDGDLRLISGSLEVCGDMGIFCMAGELHCGYPSAAAFSVSSPSEATPSMSARKSMRTEDGAGFRIVVNENQPEIQEGQIIAGIAYEAQLSENKVRNLDLSNLYIEVSGRLSFGVYNHVGDVTADRCEITVSGSQMAYGIQAKGKISLSYSGVTADGPAGSSLVSDSGDIYYDENDSFAYGPEYENELPYIVTGLTEPLKSIAVRVHSDAEAIPFPEKAEVILKNTRTSAEKMRRIAVEEWDTSMVSLDQTGIYYAGGKLSDESLLRASASNALDITAAQRVNVLDETGTFIDDILYYKEMQRDEGKTQFTVYCPRPEGAKALYVEYNRDGENWLLYEWKTGENNWLENRNVMQAYEPYDRLMLDVTVPYDNGTVGVRLRTVGGIYEGIGLPSTVNMNDGTVSDVWNQDSVDDGSGGDRGGGTVEPEKPGQVEKPGQSGQPDQPEQPGQKPDGDDNNNGSVGDGNGTGNEGLPDSPGDSGNSSGSGGESDNPPGSMGGGDNSSESNGGNGGSSNGSEDESWNGPGNEPGNSGNGESSGNLPGVGGELPGSGNLSGGMNAGSSGNLPVPEIAGGGQLENGGETAGVQVKNTELPAAAEKAEEDPAPTAAKKPHEDEKQENSGANRGNAEEDGNRPIDEALDAEKRDDGQADTDLKTVSGVQEEAASSAGSISQNGKVLVKVLTAVIILSSALLACACLIRLWIKKMA